MRFSPFSRRRPRRPHTMRQAARFDNPCRPCSPLFTAASAVLGSVPHAAGRAAIKRERSDGEEENCNRRRRRGRLLCRRAHVQAGEDVTFIDPWPEHVERMRTAGLRITHLRDVEPFTVRPRALHITEVQQLSKEAPVDIAFVCMKSYDTAWATALIRQYLAPHGYIVSLQNCMNEETIASLVGWGKTMGCIASSITVELFAPGEVRRAAGKSGSRHTVFRTGEVHGRITER